MTPAATNLDLVRSIYAAWERGDWSSAEWAHPEIEFVVADGPSPFSSTGVARMAASWRQWLSAWEGYRVAAEEYRELDDERVLALVRYGGRGRTSGLELGQIGPKAVTLFHVRDGKVTKIVGYNSRDRGLADFGLAPEAGSDRG
ncbi:MAG: nuclear transport factor 2 family protein [Actinomycetota bacterium]|nr:nuclear transport factor 2 family protein [Actinomycetota bacterium]